MKIPSTLRVGIVAGESSGDLIASHLIRSLRVLIPQLEIEGIAGPKMIEEGCKPLYSIQDLSVMGFVDVLARLKPLLQIRKTVIDHFIKNPPDIFIGIDVPDFNLPIEEKLRQKNILTVQYNSPTVWAWREYRLKKIRKAVDLMLTQFPFESAYYEKINVPVRYVGHPLADSIPLEVNKDEYRTILGLSSHEKVIALLPGSRESEIRHMGKLFIDTAIECLRQDPSLKFIVPMVNEERKIQFDSLLAQYYLDKLPIQLIVNDAHIAIAASDLVLAKCGTVTLEALLLKKPMVVAYSTSLINYLIGKCLIKIKYFSLPNLLSTMPLVPEFIQHQATAKNLANALMARLNDPHNNQALIEQFKMIHEGLRRNASVQATNAILSLLTASRHGDKIEL